MIDKKMYFYWGNETMSWMRYLSVYTFKKLNPTWEVFVYKTKQTNKIKTWRDSPTQDLHNFNGLDYFQKLKELDIHILDWEFDKIDIKNMGASHLSNFFKWDTLGKHSGFFSDLDILYLKSMDEFYDEVKDFDVIINFTHHFSIGFLASSGNNKFYSDVVEATIKNYTNSQYQSAGVLALNSLCSKLNRTLNLNSNLYEILQKHYKDLKFHNFDMSLLYFWKHFEMNFVFEELKTNLPDNSLGIHWYAGDAVAQKWNNILNSENYTKYNNTFTYYAKKVLV